MSVTRAALAPVTSQPLPAGSALPCSMCWSGRAVTELHGRLICSGCYLDATADQDGQPWLR